MSPLSLVIIGGCGAVLFLVIAVINFIRVMKQPATMRAGSFIAIHLGSGFLMGASIITALTGLVWMTI